MYYLIFTLLFKNAKYLLMLCFTDFYSHDTCFVIVLSAGMKHMNETCLMNNKYVKQHQEVFCILETSKRFAKFQQSKLLLLIYFST